MNVFHIIACWVHLQFGMSEQMWNKDFIQLHRTCFEHRKGSWLHWFFVSTLRNVFFTNYAKYSHQQKTFRFSSGFNILTLKTIDIMVCVNNHSLKWDVRINASPSWETVILMNLNSDILDCRYTCLISIRFTTEKLSAVTDEQAFEARQQKHQILTSHHWQASHQIGVTWGEKTSTTKPYNCSYHV